MGLLPFVSVVVPVRNGEQTIADCLESLLAQDYPKERYEIFVVDNDSTDRTATIIRRYPVTRLLERDAHSPAAARNRGIREARGEIIACIDGDCRAAPDWLRRGVAAFGDNRIGCVAGAIHAESLKTLTQRYVEERGCNSQRWAVHESLKPFAQTANALYRRCVFDHVGWFDVSLTIGEDADLSWRMQDQMRLVIAFCPEAVVYHRHPATVRRLLRQRKGYGYASVRLYVQYQQQMERQTLKYTYWDALALARRVRRLAAACGGLIGSWLRGRHEPEPIAMAWLDVLSYLWWKLGQAQGSIRYRTWYL